MTLLNHSDIQHIAKLAQIKITLQEAELLQQKLQNILFLIMQLQEKNTDDITPMTHTMEIYQRLREDKVIELNQREFYQKLAPQVENGLYVVPQVIE